MGNERGSYEVTVQAQSHFHALFLHRRNGPPASTSSPTSPIGTTPPCRASWRPAGHSPRRRTPALRSGGPCPGLFSAAPPRQKSARLRAGKLDSGGSAGMRLLIAIPVFARMASRRGAGILPAGTQDACPTLRPVENRDQSGSSTGCQCPPCSAARPVICRCRTG